VTLPHITTVESLHAYLYAALQLEHATIPPYLSALYSIHPGTNLDAVMVIRVVAVEEMLHLTLAANVLNATGGTPDLTGPGFVPSYPAYLPDGEDDFRVDRQRFSPEAVETFLKIERPGAAPDEEARVLAHDSPSSLLVAPHDDSMRFYSIGEFYEEIRRGLEHLHDELGDGLFSGDPQRQVTPEYYYSGGGEIVPVTDLASASAALELIAEQGEGLGGRIYDEEGEIAHYHRFEQLKIGRYYQPGDTAGSPSGPELSVDWDAVYPMKTNVVLGDLRDAPDLHASAEAFNERYADFLGLLTRAYTGEPALLMDAVAEMFRLRDGMLGLIRHPMPGPGGLKAGPTFEVGGPS
jgi:hypothetical protein